MVYQRQDVHSSQSVRSSEVDADVRLISVSSKHLSMDDVSDWSTDDVCHQSFCEYLTDTASDRRKVLVLLLFLFIIFEKFCGLQQKLL